MSPVSDGFLACAMPLNTAMPVFFTLCASTAKSVVPALHPGRVQALPT